MAFPGWQNLVVCGVDPVSTTSPQTDPTHVCGFADMVVVTEHVVADLVILGIFATTFVAMFAGYKLITSQGNPNAMSEAKRMLMNVVKGFALMVSAWLIVHLITDALLGPGYSLLK